LRTPDAPQADEKLLLDAFRVAVAVISVKDICVTGTGDLCTGFLESKDKNHPGVTPLMVGIVLKLTHK
jgi:hypothetical protein